MIRAFLPSQSAPEKHNQENVSVPDVCPRDLDVLQEFEMREKLTCDQGSYRFLYAKFNTFSKPFFFFFFQTQRNESIHTPRTGISS